MKNFTTDSAPYKEIETRVNFEGKASAGKLIALVSAILIDSIGLTQNSIKVIVGASIISPLIGSILSIGFALGTGNLKRFSHYTIDLLLEILLGLILSTLYFIIFPISMLPSESIAHTSVSILDIIIAVFGGIAATLELTRKKTAFIIPGVAIASSLTTPLCTAGLGIVRKSPSYFLDSLYVFITFSFFLIFSSCITTALLRIPSKPTNEKSNQDCAK